MADRFNDPPLSTKVSVAVSSFGWLLGALLGAGTVAWCRAVKRVLS